MAGAADRYAPGKFVLAFSDKHDVVYILHSLSNSSSMETHSTSIEALCRFTQNH